MLKALMKIFGRQESSGEVARKRLKVVLIHDRAAVSPEIMDHLKQDILAVVAKYIEINPQEMDISLEKDEDSVALVANIPVTNLRHGGKR